MSQDTNGNLAAYDDDSVSNFVYWPEKTRSSKNDTATAETATTLTLPAGA